MTAFICMDGLGGNPELTFYFLKKEFGQENNQITLIDISNSENWTHRDRINKVCQEIAACSDPIIFLVGQSAGGSAVQIAAAESSRKISGVIALSPALPRGYLFFTSTLLKMMLRWKNIWRIILGKTLVPTKEEYRSLISPFPEEHSELLLSSIQPIPGRESRELAFFPPKKSKVVCPMLIVFGAKDQWISCQSLRKFATTQKKNFPSLVSVLEVENSGHLSMFSKRKKDVIVFIKNWISFREEAGVKP